MKNILFILIATLIFTSSCTKIIDIELDDADKRTSIDAQIKMGVNDVTARVTKSGNFFGSNTNTELTDATVVLNDGTTDFPLINMGKGNYELSGFNGIAGQSYSMKVTQGGTTFDATTSIPSLVLIDTVSATFTPQSAFSDSGYLLTIKFQDPAAEANYYRIEVEFPDGRSGAVDDLILLDDDLLNGNYIEFPLFGAEIAQLGDSLTIYLKSIDKQAYAYFLAVDELLFGDAATPANPKSNFNNNALGNFSGFATDSISIVVQ